MMLTLDIRLLTGRLAAAQVNNQAAPEWPPHPARVYSALVATLHDGPEPDPAEERALEWLAGAGAPEIMASGAEQRHMGSVYVPTNDAKVLADIDRQIEKLEAAEEAAQKAAGPQQKKAQRALERAQQELQTRSSASAQAGGGTPAAAHELIDRRAKPQPRRFPAAIPHDDVVHFCWPVEIETTTVDALDAVAARVTRLGHSSSLVACRFHNDPVDAGGRQRFVPSEDGSIFLRVAVPDQLRRLREAHAHHLQVETRLLPARQAAYRVVDQDAEQVVTPGTVFSESDWFIFEVVAPPGERRRLLDLSLAQHLARAMRGTLLRSLDLENAPAALTGHLAAGAPATVPHLAYVPLADVGSQHSSGSILGLALIPPLDLGREARHLLLEAIHEAEAQSRPAGAAGTEGPATLRLTLGRHGVVHLQRITGVPSLKALQPPRWTRRSTRWYTATAIALSRNPGDLQSRDAQTIERAVKNAEASIGADCENIGLPRPVAVWIHRRSLLSAAPSARRFMPFPTTGDGLRRVCVHAEIVFDRPVTGPLLLGAGRYFGLGLCAPVLREEGA